MADVVAISNAAADAAGIPRQLLLAAGIAESNLNPRARRPQFSADDRRYWPDVSGGCWQQTVRWDPDYNGGGAYPGQDEIERVLALQYDPERSSRVAAANLGGKYFADESDAVFKALCRYNWPGGHGAPATTEVGANYRAGIAEAQTILGAAPMPTTPVYNADTPLILQNDPWSCWPTSARMALESWGRHPSEGWIESQAQTDGIVSMDQGLLDGSGAAGAAWLTKQYSDPGEGTPTIKASNEASVSFDNVKAVAGHMGVLLGGHRWGGAGHWTFVRRYDPSSDTLMLGNPAGVYDGIGQTMNRDQFARVGPFSMVMLVADGAVPTPIPTPPPPADELAALRAENERLRTVIGYASHDIGAALDKESASIRANLGALDAAISTLKGQS